MTSDHKSLRIKSSDIHGMQKAKDANYQTSGIASDDVNKLSIEDTPFNLDQEK